MYRREKESVVMKKMLMVVLTLCLIVSAVPVFADTSDVRVKSITSFKQELQTLPALTSKLYESEASELVGDTDPDVVRLFVEEKLALAEDKMENYQINLELDGITEERIDLGDGCYLKVTVSDTKDKTTTEVPLNSVLLRGSTPGAETLWKDYGARMFTATFEIALPVVLYYHLNLANHYTLSANGIEVRYGEAWANCTDLADASYGNINVTKNTAKIGQSVSMNCTFTLTQTLNVTFSRSVKMTNTVKCSDIDTIDKQVKVVQSWTGAWL